MTARLAALLRLNYTLAQSPITPFDRHRKSAEPGALRRAVSVASVFDPQDDDLMQLVVDAVQHSIGTAPGGPNACKIVAELLADPLRVLDQGSREESITAVAPVLAACSRWLAALVARRPARVAAANSPPQ